MPYNLKHIVNSSVFIAVIVAFGVCSIFNCLTSRATISVDEERTLAPFPAWNHKQRLSDYAHELELYYDDRLPWRFSLCEMRSLISDSLNHSKISENAVVGKDNWLFSTLPGMWEAQINLTPFKQLELRLWLNALQKRKDFLDAHGIKYIVVVPPEKGSVYSDYLPSGLSRRRGPSRLDQLQNGLASKTTVPFVDAKSTLLALKNCTQPLYLHRDTHWNAAGGLYVAQQLLQRIHQFYPSVNPVAVDGFTFRKNLRQGFDLSRMLSLRHDQYLEPELVLNPVKCERRSRFVSKDGEILNFASSLNRPKLFMIRDSYGTALIPALTNEVGNSHVVEPSLFDPKAILAEKPDVVVQEFVERTLYTTEPENCLIENRSSGVLAGKDSVQNKMKFVFDNKLELRGCASKSPDKKVVLLLTWQAKTQSRLTGMIGVQLLNARKQVIAGKVYKQDIYERSVMPGFSWRELTELPIPSTLNLKNSSVRIFATSSLKPALMSVSRSDCEPDRSKSDHIDGLLSDSTIATFPVDCDERRADRLTSLACYSSNATE